MARRFNSRGGPQAQRAPRRATNWAAFGSPSVFKVNPLERLAIVAKLSQMQGGVESTLIRTRGELMVRNETLLEPAPFSVGITIVSDEAAAAGSASLPSPALS